MASLWRRQNSRFWIGCFTAPDGRQLKRSTKTTDRKLALKLTNAWEEAALRKMTETQARRVISDLYAMVVGSALPSSSVHEFLNNWLQRKRVEVEPGTFGKYQNIVAQFDAFLGDRAGMDLAHLTSKDVASFRDSLAARLSPATANLAIKILRGALSQANPMDC